MFLILERPSLHGVSRGVIKQRGDWDACWIVGESLPVWILALPGLPLVCQRILLQGRSDVDTLARLVPGSVEIDISSKGHWALPSDLAPPTWVLVDGRPSRSCLTICEQFGIHRILSTQPARFSKKRGRAVRSIRSNLE